MGTFLSEATGDQPTMICAFSFGVFGRPLFRQNFLLDIPTSVKRPLLVNQIRKTTALSAICTSTSDSSSTNTPAPEHTLPAFRHLHFD
jgi:hypothetical protein